MAASKGLTALLLRQGEDGARVVRAIEKEGLDSPAAEAALCRLLRGIQQQELRKRRATRPSGHEHDPHRGAR